jgi:hypothetical protein
MRYKIIQSRDKYIVYEEDKILKIFHSYNDANAYVQHLEYINLIHLLMTDY